MNKQNFNQLGGFPFETDTLDWMQAAYSIFNAIGHVVGNYTIISGCEVNGANVSDGVVFVDGELYKFVGGNIQTTVRVLETATQKEFENGDVKDVHFERYVTFASGTGAINWSEFKRPETLKNLSSRILPAGTNPQLFSGDVNAIPEGWQLCDGTNNTPDLRKRFIVGYDPTETDYNAIGKTGGEKDVALTEGQMPSHSHSASSSSAGSHSHNISIRLMNENGHPLATGSGETASGNDNGFEQSVTWQTQSAGSHTHSISVSNKGGGEAHENRPPYYVLAYIIYTGL